MTYGRLGSFAWVDLLGGRVSLWVHREYGRRAVSVWLYSRRVVVRFP